MKRPITGELPVTIRDEENGLTYDLIGDYYYPRLGAPDEPVGDVGRFGRMRKKYLKEHNMDVFLELLYTEALEHHLKAVNDDAIAMIGRITDRLAKAEGVTEELKARDQLGWIRAMDSCRARAEEQVIRELVLA